MENLDTDETAVTGVVEPGAKTRKLKDAPPPDPRDQKARRYKGTANITRFCKVCRKQFSHPPSRPQKTCSMECRQIRSDELKKEREIRAQARRDADLKLAQGLLANQAKADKKKAKLIQKQISETEALVQIMPKGPLTPDLSAELRGQIAAYMGNQIDLAANVVLGNIEWTPQQVQLFRALLNKVTPDLNANFIQGDGGSATPGELSRQELLEIAAGKKQKTIHGQMPIPRDDHLAHSEIEEAEIVETPNERHQ